MLILQIIKMQTRVKYHDMRNYHNDTRARDLTLKLKYNCRFCGNNYKKQLPKSFFKQPCGNCGMASHIHKVTSSFITMFATYRCPQKKTCNAEWTQKFPFKNIVLHTPTCTRCRKLTKIRLITFNNSVMIFNNSYLYKCEQCSKCKSTGALFNKVQVKTQNGESFSKFQSPVCDDCRCPMKFLKNLKSIFSQKKKNENFSKNFLSQNFSRCNWQSNDPRSLGLEEKFGKDRKIKLDYWNFSL